MHNLDEIAGELSEYIYAETGISVKPEDFRYEAEDRFQVFLFG